LLRAAITLGAGLVGAIVGGGIGLALALADIQESPPHVHGGGPFDIGPEIILVVTVPLGVILGGTLGLFVASPKQFLSGIRCLVRFDKSVTQTGLDVLKQALHKGRVMIRRSEPAVPAAPPTQRSQAHQASAMGSPAEERVPPENAIGS
jgi:hypothetical protein